MEPKGNDMAGDAQAEMLAAIDFAINLEDHYDRLEFLNAWRDGSANNGTEWTDWQAVLARLSRSTSTDAVAGDAPFVVGDRVEKLSGYRFPGVVTAVDTENDDRYVVTADHPDFTGMKHIFAGAQLRVRQDNRGRLGWPDEQTSAAAQPCAECGRPLGATSHWVGNNRFHPECAPPACPSPQGGAEPVFAFAWSLFDNGALSERRLTFTRNDPFSAYVSDCDGRFISIAVPLYTHSLGETGGTERGERQLGLDPKKGIAVDREWLNGKLTRLDEITLQILAAESSLAAEKLKVEELTAAAEHQMHHTEVVRANAAGLEQRVAALVGALTAARDDAKAGAAYWNNPSTAAAFKLTRTLDVSRENSNAQGEVYWQQHVSDHAAYAADVAECEAEIAELRLALKPLMDWLAKLEAEFSKTDDSVIAGGIRGISITFGDLRGIRAALTRKEG